MLEKRLDETTMQYVQRQDAYNRILSKLLAGIRQMASWSDQSASMDGQLWVVDGVTWTAETLGLTAEEVTSVASVLRGGTLLRRIIAKVTDPAVSAAEIEALEAAIATLVD